MMKRTQWYWCVVGVGLLLGGAAVCPAGYVIDGRLEDWGVDPFVDWQPTSSTVDYVIADGKNSYDAVNYWELYDFEALYFDDDADNFYFAVVGSYPMAPGTDGGDLGLDLNGDVTISEHGVVTGLEYAVRISTEEPGEVLASPAWVLTSLHRWPDGWQGSPWQTSGGQRIGDATVALNRQFDLEDGTYIVEVALPRVLIDGAAELLPGHVLTTHMSNWCGNDSINLEGTIDVPEVATVALMLLGIPALIPLRQMRRSA